MKEKEVSLLESEIDVEMLNFIIDDKNKQNRNIQIIIDAGRISYKEKKIICKYLNKIWIKVLEEEGFISTSKHYHFLIKKYSETKYLIQLKLSYLRWIPKRFLL